MNQRVDERLTGLIRQYVNEQDRESVKQAFVMIYRRATNQTADDRIYFDDFRLHGIDYGDFFKTIVDALFGVNGTWKYANFIFEANRIKFVINLLPLDPPFLQGQNSTRRWRVLASQKDLRSDFKEILYSLHNRLCTLEVLNKNIH